MPGRPGSRDVRAAARPFLERIAALDRALRAGRYPNAVGLARELEVSHRTVQRDIDFLRDRLGAPLAYDGRRHGYRYTDPTYRLPLWPVTEGELVALFLAERVLQQYRGTPYAGALARVFRKIAAGLPEQVTIDLGDLDRVHSFRTSAPLGMEPETFLGLVAAIRGRRRLALRYYSASRDAETQRQVDPYHLACVDGQWYLVGYCHARTQVRMFVPARIRGLQVTEDAFEPPADFRIEDYLARSFAVLRGGEGEAHRVRLRFTGPAARYVRERRWHPSQAVEETEDGALLMSLEVSHLREVERFVLSWLPDCEVLEPVALRQRLARTLGDSLTRHLHPAAQPSKQATKPAGNAKSRRGSTSRR
jgi:predicted DNA-binding transcriptional regulator YafY